MIVRKFHEDNAEKVSAMIIHTLKTSNSKDYSAEDINALEKQMQPAGILERASWTHFYVAEELLGQRDGKQLVHDLCFARVSGQRRRQKNHRNA